MTNKRGKSPFFSDDDFKIDPLEMNIKPETPEKPDYSPKIVFGATQGRKGHKAPRMNMAFSPVNHVWLKTKSRQLGISATDLVNQLIDQARLKD